MGVFEYGIVSEIFGLKRPEMGDQWYEFEVASVNGRRVRFAGGLLLPVIAGLEALSRADIIVLPGWSVTESPPAVLIDALRTAAARGARLVSICTGAFALAATGLLNGKRATTHWLHADALQARYPGIRMEPDVLYVDENKIFTSAGSAAGIDLCLHIVRCDYGAKAANIVARRMVVAPHREGGQKQYVETPVPSAYEAGRLSNLIARLPRRLDHPLTIAELAEEAGMSERTFVRRFQAATGMPPGKWLIQMRVRRARDLLEATNATIDEVALRCGFADASTLRRHFTTHVGATPSNYRSAFGGAR
jgi:AraC family transcriptional activator FtrA